MKPKIKALLKAIEEGKIHSTKVDILSIIIKDGGNITEHTIAARLREHRQRATIIGRLSELMDLGVIYVPDTYKDGTKSYYKFEPNEEKQNLNRIKRSEEQYKRWRKMGYSKGWIN